ncbi:hypothetical protein [Halorarum salinum]|uniref:Uncharacterized protein n=1 Tax=Halorarum salinum TaxID=2743089 RepID=A0A7D5LCC8_9EURY|nr:hypothetical protein [Halobaculum salinum]QLG63087.1 hypothetical protein HUG12_15640 [Halobaculum salinum]
MRLQNAFVGEDVPITITYEDDAGAAVDPDDTATEPTVTVVDVPEHDAESETDVVSDQLMNQNGTGDFEYVWDTSGLDAGEYRIEVTADFSTETKIVKQTILLE